MTALPFPPGFLWGAATAAHAVEGGHPRSDWWIWEQTPGHVADGQDSRVASDWWTRADEDFVAAARLGLGALRFSVEWSRVEPEEGRFDEAALARYVAWAERLRSLGLEPVVCLLHETLPAWLAAQGGLAGRGAVERIARYADRVAEALGDRVRWWLTVSDPVGWVRRGWLEGSAPPGRHDLAGAILAARHLLHAHAAAARRIRARAPGALVSAAVTWHPVEPGAARSLVARGGAWLRDWLTNRAWLEAALDGRVSPPLGAFERDKALAGSLDFVAVQADGEALGPAVAEAARHRRPILVAAHRPAHPSAPEALTRPLVALHRALRGGADLRGYLHWSLVDGFEWSEGYRRSSGLFAVDRATQARTLTARALALGEIARANSLQAG